MRWKDRIAALAGCITVLCGMASAQPVVIPSPEPGMNGNFGLDVDLDDGVLLVGAPEGADGDVQGNAYLYNAENGSLIAELFQANGTDASSVFGLSVALGGGIAAVGGPGDEINEIDRAWIYDAADGSLLHELLAPSGLGIQEFGLAVSVTESGAGPSGDDPIVAVSGGLVMVTPTIRFQRYVMLYNGRTGANIANILPDDDATGGTFGQELDVFHDGTKGRLVVAANSSTFFAQSGAQAYLFDITDPASPTQITSFIGSDTVDADEFATAVSTDGDTIVVNAPFRVGAGDVNGAIYLFDADSGSEIGLLTRPGSLDATLSGFAPNLDIVDSFVIYGTGDATGSATTYVQAIDGTVIAELASPDPTMQGVFGFGVALEVNGATIDAAISDPIAPAIDKNQTGPGEAYVFSDVSGLGGGCDADLADPMGVLNFFDVAAFITAYNAMDLVADVAAPFGTFNFFDVSGYIALYNAGCP